MVCLRAKKLIKLDDKVFIGASTRRPGLAYFYAFDCALPEVVLVLAVHCGVDLADVIGMENEILDGFGGGTGGLLLGEGGADLLLQLGVVGLVGGLVDKAVDVKVFEAGELRSGCLDALIGGEARRGAAPVDVELV